MLQSLFDIYVDYIFSLFHFQPSYSFKTLFIRSRPTFLMLVTIVKFYKFYKAGFIRLVFLKVVFLEGGSILQEENLILI